MSFNSIRTLSHQDVDRPFVTQPSTRFEGVPHVLGRIIIRKSGRDPTLGPPSRPCSPSPSSPTGHSAPAPEPQGGRRTTPEPTTITSARAVHPGEERQDDRFECGHAPCASHAPQFHGAVVNQPRGSHQTGNKKPRRTGRCQQLAVISSNIEVIDSDAGSIQDTLCRGDHSIWSCGGGGSAGGKCLGNSPGIFSLFVCQIRVPRTQGEPIGVSNRVDTNDIDAKPEVVVHAADQFQLLEILFAEHGSIGAHLGE